MTSEHGSRASVRPSCREVFYKKEESSVGASGNLRANTLPVVEGHVEHSVVETAREPEGFRADESAEYEVGDDETAQTPIVSNV